MAESLIFDLDPDRNQSRGAAVEALGRDRDPKARVSRCPSRAGIGSGAQGSPADAQRIVPGLLGQGPLIRYVRLQ